MRATVTTAIVFCLIGAIAVLVLWVAKLEYRLGETQTDVNRLANMVSDLKIAVSAKE